MARTPLLRSLQRLAKEHHRGRGVRIAPAELRERVTEAEYSRREFLKRSGAVGAGRRRRGPLALAAPARAAGTGRPRVAIVGAGIAGLNAALDPPGQGDRVDGLRSVRPRRRSHALRPQRLLGERADQRVLRRADRLGPHDDSRARVAVQPRRSPTCSRPSPPARRRRTGSSAAGTRRSGGRRLRAGSRRREERPTAAGYPTLWNKLQARRGRARPT